MKDNTQPSLYEQNCRQMGVEPSPDKEQYHQQVRQQIMMIERMSRNTFAMFAAHAPDTIEQWFNPTDLPPYTPRPTRPASINDKLEEWRLLSQKREGREVQCSEEVLAHIDAVLAWQKVNEQEEHARMREEFFQWRFAYATEMYNRLMMGPKGK